MAWYSNSVVVDFAFPAILMVGALLGAHLLDLRNTRRQAIESATQKAEKLDRTVLMLVEEIVDTSHGLAEQAKHWVDAVPDDPFLSFQSLENSVWPDVKDTILTSSLPPEQIRRFVDFFSFARMAFGQSQIAEEARLAAAQATAGTFEGDLRVEACARAVALAHNAAFAAVDAGKELADVYGTPVQCVTMSRCFNVLAAGVRNGLTLNAKPKKVRPKRRKA